MTKHMLVIQRRPADSPGKRPPWVTMFCSTTVSMLSGNTPKSGSFTTCDVELSGSGFKVGGQGQSQGLPRGQEADMSQDGAMTTPAQRHRRRRCRRSTVNSVGRWALPAPDIAIMIPHSHYVAETQLSHDETAAAHVFGKPTAQPQTCSN